MPRLGKVVGVPGSMVNSFQMDTAQSPAADAQLAAQTSQTPHVPHMPAQAQSPMLFSAEEMSAFNAFVQARRQQRSAASSAPGTPLPGWDSSPTPQPQVAVPSHTAADIPRESVEEISEEPRPQAKKQRGRPKKVAGAPQVEIVCSSKRNMNVQEKLVLARQCAAHQDEFRARATKGFWTMISRALKQETGYDLKEPRLAVGGWMDKRKQEQLDSEMGSGNEEQLGDFKAALDAFAERYYAVQAELTNNKEKAEKEFEDALVAARHREGLLFQTRDEYFNETSLSETSSLQALKSKKRKAREQADASERLIGAVDKIAGIFTGENEPVDDGKVAELQQTVKTVQQDLGALKVDMTKGMDELKSLLIQVMGSRESSS